MNAVRCVAVPMDFCASMTPRVAAIEGARQKSYVRKSAQGSGAPMSSPWMSLSVADPTYDAMPSEWASTQWTASLRVTVPVGNPSWVGIGSVTGEQN